MENIDNKEDVDKKLLEFYKNAEHISIIPLLKLIYLTTEIDLSEQFKLQHSIKSKESENLIAGELLFSNNEKKYKIYLDIVDKNYDLLDSLKHPLISAISFMTQACLVIFNKLKDSNEELLEHTLSLDNNTTIYIDSLLEKRIGVVFK